MLKFESRPSRSVKFLFTFCALALLLIADRTVVAESAPQLSVDQVMQQFAAKDAERAKDGQAYRGLRHYTVDYKGFPSDKHAEMVVRVSSSASGKEFMIVDESGSKLLLDRVLHKLVDSEREANGSANKSETKLNESNYKFQLVGSENVGERKCYVVAVDPKRDNKFLYKGKIWIDAQDFAVVKISAKPAKNPSFWISSVQIEHAYEKYGNLWLPRSNRSTSKTRFGGTAVLTIDYDRYELPESRRGGSGE